MKNKEYLCGEKFPILDMETRYILAVTDVVLPLGKWGTIASTCTAFRVMRNHRNINYMPFRDNTLPNQNEKTLIT